MENETRQLFETLGLSAEAGHIYHTLLEKGHMGVSDIARHVGLYRPQVYELLEQLTKEGFVTERPSGKRTHYEAAHPKALSERADALAKEAHDLVPRLTRMFVSEPTADVRTLTEGEGIAAAYMDIVLTLPKGATFYHYSAVRDQEKIDSYVPDDYRPTRDRKELERLTIASAYVGSKKKPRLERYLKVLPVDNELFGQNVDQFIYDTRVSFFSFDEKRTIIIDDPALADFERRKFLVLFGALK